MQPPIETHKRTRRQRLASIANGRKSRGPVTPEGKRRSAKNRTTFGYTAELTLTVENSAEAHILDSLYQDTLHPQTPIELFYAQTMVAAHARILRLRRHERDLLQLRLANNHDAESHFENLDGEARATLAFASEAEHDALPLLMRYEGRTFRAYDQAWTRFRQLRPDIHPTSGLGPQPPACSFERPQPAENKQDEKIPIEPKPGPAPLVALLALLLLFAFFFTPQAYASAPAKTLETKYIQPMPEAPSTFATAYPKPGSNRM